MASDLCLDPLTSPSGWGALYAGQTPAAATVDGVQCINLPCNFTLSTTQAAWEKTVSLNLTTYDRFCFKIKVPDLSMVNSIAIKFQCGSGGWWTCNAGDLSTDQWQNVIVSKASFEQEGGSCNGWGSIIKIRLLVSQAQTGNTIVSWAALGTQQTDNLIDSFIYPDQQSAAAAWVAGAGAIPPVPATEGGIDC
ncbi:MAG: hypothetical protein PHT33_14405, partial [bacterium]|nr:hypothetical protein [bacterium]